MITFLRDRGLQTLRWLQRLSGGIVEPEIVAYLRDRGPICYGLPLYTIAAEEAFITQLPQQLLSSGLGWCWESGRNAPVADTSPVRDLPEQRPLTLLTLNNAESLVSDYRERDVDGYGRFIALFGCEAEAILRVLNPTNLRAALEDFVAHEEGPMRMVLIHIGDSVYDYAFVPHPPVEMVRILLEAWGVDPISVRKTRPYGELYSARLEDMLEAMFRLSSGNL